MTKRIIVTGATGFIGRQTLRPLVDAGFAVHAISSKPRPLDDGGKTGVTWHCHDILADRAFDPLFAEIQATHLLHLAWYAEPGRYWTSLVNLDWVAASLDLVTSFGKHGGQRIVGAGSCAEYDWRYGYCSEFVTPTNPATLYGVSKDALWRLIEGMSGQLRLSSAWGRVFFLYGPHEHPNRLVSSVIASLLRNEAALCTSGEQVRDFLHVHDVGRAFTALVESDVSGPVNIGSGEPVRVKDIVQEIGRQMGADRLLHLGAKRLSAAEPSLLVADNRRLAHEVDWQPSYNLEQGLAETIRWWQQQEDSRIDDK